MIEWQTVRLGTIVSTNQNTYSPKEDWQFVNYLDTGNITMNKVDEIQCINTLTEKLPSRARRKVKSDSIIYSTVRPNQLHYGIIKEQPENFLVSTGFVVIDVDFEKAVPDYIYYALTRQEVTEHLQAIAEQSVSAYPSIKPSDIENLELLLPDKNTQGKIVAILNSIDEKIKVNNEINNNLQQQAFALFDKLLSGEHLEVCTLSEIAELNPKRSLAKNEMTRCIDMAQLSTSGSFPNGWQIKPYNGGMRFANGDTLLARITPCLENGKTAYIDFLDTDEIAFGSTEYVVLCSKGQYPSEFFYCLARYPSFVDYAVKNMNGSSGRQRVSAETVGKYLLPRLTDDELAEFRDVVPALFSAIRLNSLENISLSELRDALLPKLMSGEIDVSDIDI